MKEDGSVSGTSYVCLKDLPYAEMFQRTVVVFMPWGLPGQRQNADRGAFLLIQREVLMSFPLHFRPSKYFASWRFARQPAAKGTGAGPMKKVAAPMLPSLFCSLLPSVLLGGGESCAFQPGFLNSTDVFPTGEFRSAYITAGKVDISCPVLQ